MITRKWNKQRVVEAIQERHRQGLPLVNIGKLDAALAGAAIQHCGTWRTAMSAAGLGGLVQQQGHKWTKREVIEAILDRNERGLPLKHVARDDARLAKAAVRLFGNWRKAMLAAGLKPLPRGIWSKELIIKEIQRRHAGGFRLASVYRSDTSLYTAAQRFFGSWGNALRAAGFPRPRRSRRRWSKRQVVEAIRQRHRQGLSMLSVGKSDPSLYAATFRYFGGWYKAMRAAGLKPTVRRRWSKEIVVQEIQARHRRGLPLADLGKHDAPLAGAAYHYFGGWNNALVAAGLPPRKRKWSRQRVIDEVRAWKAKGLPTGRIWKEFSGLGRAAREYVGSWHDVMKAAGFESTPQKRWSPQRVIKELRAWHRQGLPNKYMGAEYQGLKVAVQRYFGHWNDALAAAGLKPHRQGKWSRQRIIREIQNRHVRGLPTRSARKQRRELRNAATRYFGNWANALEAAGLLRPEDKPKPRAKWSKERVIVAIHARYEKGLLMTNVCRDNMALAGAATRYFGGWRNAMMAAGFQPAQGQWNKQLLIDEIQYRHERGMTTANVWRDNPGLFYAAKRYFGDWHAAMLAAGLASETPKPKPRVRWSRQRVIEELQARHKAGLSLNCTHPTNRLLYGAAKRHLGGWRKALATAGIDPQITKPTYQKKAKGT